MVKGKDDAEWGHSFGQSKFKPEKDGIFARCGCRFAVPSRTNNVDNMSQWMNLAYLGMKPTLQQKRSKQFPNGISFCGYFGQQKFRGRCHSIIFCT